MAKIPSTHDGIVRKINYKNDEICLVGKALVDVEVGGDAKAKTSSSKKEETPKKMA